MLSRRFVNDGQPGIPLNRLQLQVRDVVAAKIADGTYRFETVACGICGATETTMLAEKDRYGLYSPVVICRTCGLIFSTPRMDQASYAAFYDREYRPLYMGKAYSADAVWEKTSRRGARIAAFLRPGGAELVGKRILEVGCGAGGALAHFRDRFNCEVKGCDFGTEGLTYGRVNHGLDLTIGTIGSIPAIQQGWRADVIIYSHVLEHILDLHEECERIRHALADDGLVYIEVPSVKGIRHNYTWDFLRYLQNAHTYHFSLTTLLNLMQRHGFQLIRGNEFTQAVFRMDAQEQGDATHLVNDYTPVMRFLKATERQRPFRHVLHPIKTARKAYRRARRWWRAGLQG